MHSWGSLTMNVVVIRRVRDLLNAVLLGNSCKVRRSWKQRRRRGQSEKKRLEEERQRLEEAKQREEVEKRRAQAIMEANALQAFAKQMTVLEEKIKDHVHSTLTASEEKSARLHDSLLRFLERTEGDVPRRPRVEPYPNPKRRLDLDECEREVNVVERSEVTPTTRRRTVVTRKGKEPACAEGKRKGAVASCSKQGVIDFILELRESMQAKQAPELKQLCRMKNIRFSPALNMVGRGAGTKQKARLGKKERQKAVAPMPMQRRGLLYITLVRQPKRYFSLAELLEDTIAAGMKAVEIVSSGGEVWGEKWSVIRRTFGTSTVAVEEVKLPLVRTKQLLERGGPFRVAPIVKTESARSRGKGYLRLLLEMSRKQAELKFFDVTKLVFLYMCAREFKTKSTRRTLKEKIAAVIRKKTGVNIRLKVNVKVKYSHHLKKRRIHDTVVLCVEKSRVHPILTTVLRRWVRVVWKKNGTVEQVLTNHRKAAREASAYCTCSQDRPPRVDGHVLARVAQCSMVLGFLHNGKNVLQSDAGTRPAEVQRAVEKSLEAVMRRDLFQVADPSVFQDIISNHVETRQACPEEKAREIAAKVSHLVVVPVDRNPGDIVVMCPSTYHHGLQMMFNLNVAYQQVSGVSETEVLAQVKAVFKEQALNKIGAWNPAARLGQTYVLPKHKDLTRWRPIAPTRTEGSKTAGRRLARVLNFLLERVPKAKHFNLKATAMLKQNLEKAEERLNIFGDRTMALMASYDIKEMFTSLPHEAVRRAVDWLLQQWELRGVFKVSLSRRGRVVTINRKSPGP
ncbi:hypothetical protein CBR_g55343 [Chara braunii]|uniref:Reverse transcriptase domain-containing protein n=1 Tax=Chara braunii TaxID=69332 RepID=A0A388MCW7_CHABU|nr:hypothetical protein CBR_g55343 [Chara braunii]|eukprot:GBG92408.1 hypothetical protein CBR_g55343 [Chara braunii]